ncbi:hypothetical protein CDEST_10162 [Colletotrichum destructivum]|uniref:Uncharacterized protein n=1 Tax=Colletotrichum destructivum TaxID=34406 RepID=A0AAX4IQI9_9PEZI|nr:hypothetical protein CDEST_10162 [Colletotrichum destructivum]
MPTFPGRRRNNLPRQFNIHWANGCRPTTGTVRHRLAFRKVPSAAWIHLAAGPMTSAQSHTFSGAPLRAPRFRAAAEMSLRRKCMQ